MGDGALFSSLKDQLIWEAILQSQEHRGLPVELIRQSQSPLPDAVFAGYGHGLSFWKYRGLPYTFHDGNTGAWNASFIRFPQFKLALVALSNNAKISPYNVVRRAADLLLKKELVSTVPFPTGPTETGPFLSEKEVAGTYCTENDFFFRFALREGILHMERYGRDDIELERESENLFHQVDDHAWKQEFTRDSSGQLQVTAYYPSHDSYSLKKVTADWMNYDFEGIDGTYLNAETGVVFTLKQGLDFNYTLSLPGGKEEAELYVPGVLLAGSYVLKVVRNGAGEVTGFLLNDGRMRRVSFKKTSKP